jgi:hypothetical protein
MAELKFRLLGDWPATGSVCIPAGTEIDGNNPEWNGIRLPTPLPIDAMALTQDAADVLCRWYPEHLHLLRCESGITIRR